MKQVFLIIVGLTIGSYAGLSKSNGIVTDSTTRLQWQDDYSDNANIVKTGNWEEALDYCSNLKLSGGGWRVPNIRELLSIVDYTKIEPSISNVFIHTGVDSFGSSYYWSSTSNPNSFSHSNPDNLSFAFSIDFMYGTQYNGHKQLDSDFYVRCVR